MSYNNNDPNRNKYNPPYPTQLPTNPPYPTNSFAWQPNEALNVSNQQLAYPQQPFQTSTTNFPPPLPPKPPQDVIDQHFPMEFTSRHASYASRDTRPEIQSFDTSQLVGPRELPSRFTAPSVPLPPVKYQEAYPQLPVTPNSRTTFDLGRSNPPSGGSNRLSRYDPRGPASSPLTTNYQPQQPSVTSFGYIDNRQVLSSPTTPGISGPRPFPSSLNSTPNHINSSPFHQQQSPELAALKLNTSITSPYTNSTQNIVDSPYASLPDIPIPNSAVSSHFESQPSLRRDSSSPTRNSLYGPRTRLEPNQSYTRQTSPSPSTSPARNYYTNRNSWNSEYSLHEINQSDDDDELSSVHGTNDIFKNEIFLNDLPGGLLNHSPLFRKSQLFDQSFTSAKENKELPQLPQIPLIPRTFSVQQQQQPQSHIDSQLPELRQSLDLPSLPFTSRSLEPDQYDACESIYFLSDVYKWSIKLEQEWADGLLVSKDEYTKALKELFHHKDPKLKDFIIEKNVLQLLNSFDKQNAIDIQNNYIRFFDNFRVSGVLTQLTGCYSGSHKDDSSTYQCYSSRCSLTIYQPPAHAIPSRLQLDAVLGDWSQYWNISNEELEELDRKQVKKQSHTFELIRQQKNAIKLGDIQLYIYGKSFQKTVPQLLPDMGRFYNDAFNSVKPLITLHNTLLLEPLMHKLNTQGKFISGIGEIYLNWASQATVPYMKYTTKMATVREFIKNEKAIESRLANWLREMDQHPEAVKAAIDHTRIFFGGFIGHTQSLLVTLKSVRDATAESDEDYRSLNEAMKAVDDLNRAIDATQETSLQIGKLDVLAKKLSWKSNVLKVDLKFNDPDRRIIKSGEVTRKSDKWLSSSNLLILLDNFLLITEPQKEGSLKIIERPIPIGFLSLETKNFSNIKPKAVEGESYPFKIRYTGQDLSYTFYADTLSERDSWFTAFTEVQQTKVKVSNLAESFKLTVLSDIFAYKDGQQPAKLPVCAPGSNVDVMLKNFQASLEQQQQRINPTAIMHSEVLSATTIHFKNQTFHLVGLGFGLYLTEAGNARGWVRVLEIKKITQLEQLDTLLIVVADKALYHFSIVSLLINYYDVNRDGHIVGERLSRNNVSFIKIGSYGDTKFLFLVKMAIKSAEFKVFTPIFDRFGVFHHFELYKKFPMNLEVSGISIFHDLFVVHTPKGFGNLLIGEYDPQPIPRFSDNVKGSKSKYPKSQFDIIKKRIKSGDCKPLKMTRVLNKHHYYLIYDSFAVVIDTMGELISEKFVFQFPFKCSKVSLEENFLICVGEDVIEVFDLSYKDTTGFISFEPIQLITGKDIKLIDENDCKISMAHPTAPGIQLVFCFERIKL